MKDRLSSTCKTMRLILGATGFTFLAICFFAFYMLENMSSTFLFIITISFIGTLGIYYFSFVKLVSAPIGLITKILEENNDTRIAKIRKYSSEFSHIGDLFINNNKEKVELQKAKERAEKNELLKSSFLTNLSHEIRTPMNAILGFSDLLSTQELSESEKKEFLTIITRSGKNLLCIIDDLIEMSKIDTHQVLPKYGAFYLDGVLNDIKKTVEVTIPKSKPLKIFLDPPKHPIVFQLISDETKFKQIVVNLINNAVKYTEEGSVRFGYKIDANNALEFYIQDSGIGISEEEHKHIFSRFNRIQNDKTINLSGLGLGLSISKAYVEMLGGEIWLESTENVGSTFYFSIPLKLNSLPVAPKKEVELNAVENVKPLTILVAEDDNINFMLVNRVMKIRNYTVLRAKNGQEAVDICRENDQIQLVIMDLKMPKLDGFQARKEIRVFKPYLPIIAHTAYSSEEVNSDAYDAGFIDCITKPLNKTKLFRVIDRIEHLTPNPILKESNLI